jgi:hypothetical protein
VAVKIEYRENSGPAAFTLGWYSASQVRLSLVSLSLYRTVIHDPDDAFSP